LAHIALPQSPLAPGRSPVRVRIRDGGRVDRPPIVFLHSGWGCEIYPFDRQAAALGERFRTVIPDRSAYGGSTPIDALPTDFHRRAAVETLAVIDALGLESPILWGHSDGAIIALNMVLGGVLGGLASPDRVSGLVLEAAHYYKRKPSSRTFFDAALTDPDSLGPGVAKTLARDHGNRWRDVIRLHAQAWRRIGDEAAPDEDFYGGRLSTLTPPVLVVHGARDPRTEPGELDAFIHELRRRPDAKTDVLMLAQGWHSPHSERLNADEVTATAGAFCADVIASSKGAPR
jgi:pimeloyl-ACP methyl ester carboxylesterase